MLMLALCAYSAGENEYGKLAIGELPGDDSNVYEYTEVAIPGRYAEINEGTAHVLFLSENGKVYAAGSNTNNETGTGSQFDIEPTEITYFRENGLEIAMIAAGAFHSLFLTKDGAVYTAGQNFRGAMGGAVVIGATSEYPVLIEAFSSSRVVFIEAVGETSFAVTSDGDVYVFGSCDDHICGDIIGVEEQYIPVKIELGFKVNTVSLGFGSVAFHARDGSIYVGGKNGQAELCTGSASPYISAPLPLSVRNIQKIALGRSFSAMLLADGRSFGCGSNFWGELGDIGAEAEQATLIFEQEAIDITVTNSGTALLLKNGSVLTSGRNLHGELGFNGTRRAFSNVFNAGNQTNITAADDYLFIYESALFLEGRTGMSAGAICGIVFSAICVAVLLCVVIVAIWRRRYRKNVACEEECAIALL